MPHLIITRIVKLISHITRLIRCILKYLFKLKTVSHISHEFQNDVTENFFPKNER